MGMVVRTNTMAVNAYRQLNMNQTALAKSLEKLASGFRVNRAADDAAGLAISEKMKAQIVGLEAASANALDGISLVQTAEGALTEVHNMLNRMVYLATKSANGTYQDEVDREAIQAEVNALLEEIDRISQSANFNGVKLLDGSLAIASKGISISAGAADRKILDLDLKATKVVATNAVYGVTLNSGPNAFPQFEQLSDVFKFFGISQDDYTITSGVTSTTPLTDAAVPFTTDFAIHAKATGPDANRDQILVAAKGNAWEYRVGADEYWDAAITVGPNASDLTLIGQTMTLNGKLYRFVGDQDKAADGLTSIAQSGDKLEDGAYAIYIGNTQVPGTPSTIAAEIANAVARVESTTSTWADSGLITSTGAPGSFADVAAMQAAQVAGTFTGPVWINSTTPAQVNFVSANFLVEGNVKSGGLILQVGDTADDFNKVTVSVDDLSSAGLGIKGLDVSTQVAAGNAIDTIRAAINKVSTNRANLGALQNRLEYTINNLDVMAENMMAANSRIRDTDMAKEMMEYTKMSILVQAATAMLAQANMQPQSILQLLQ